MAPTRQQIGKRKRAKQLHDQMPGNCVNTKATLRRATLVNTRYQTVHGVTSSARLECPLPSKPSASPARPLP